MGNLSLRKAALRGGLAAFLLAVLAGCGGAAIQNPAAPDQDPAPAGSAESGEGLVQVLPFEGFTAPEIAAQNVRTGDVVRLSDYRGQLVMVNFWATWCSPCRKEMPAMERFAKEAEGRVQVLAVAADGTEPPERLAAFADDLALSFPVLFDGGAAGIQYRAFGLPTTLFIDGSGVVQIRVSGPMTYEQMVQLAAQAAEAADQPAENAEGTEG